MNKNLSFFLWCASGSAIGFFLRFLWISGFAWWIVALSAVVVIPIALGFLVWFEERMEKR